MYPYNFNLYINSICMWHALSDDFHSSPPLLAVAL